MSSAPSQREPQRPFFDGATFHERRGAPRHPASGQVTGVVSDPADPARPKRICALELMNISDTGLGAVSAEALPTGAHVSLFGAPHGNEPGMDLRGTIVRCRTRGEGRHEIGVQFITPRQAA